MKKFIIGLFVSAMMAMPLTAYAANPITETTEQWGEAVITTEVAPAYIVTIPADTKVPFNATETDFGKLYLEKATLEPGYYVFAGIYPDFELVNKAEEEKTIPYDITLRYENNGRLRETSAKTNAIGLEKEGDGADLTIRITEDDWNKAYAGEYSDTVTFWIFYGDDPTKIVFDR